MKHHNAHALDFSRGCDSFDNDRATHTWPWFVDVMKFKGPLYPTIKVGELKRSALFEWMAKADHYGLK
jgi:hypothetical protein